MKKFKKIVTLLSAILCSLFTIISAFPKNAFGMNELPSMNATTSLKDPNGDGVQDLFDSIYIREFLYGKVDTTNYNEFDINNNYLITFFDAWIIDARQIGILPTPNSSKVITTATATSDYVYYKHDCSSTNPLSYTSYTLSRPLNSTTNMKSGLNNTHNIELYSNPLDANSSRGLSLDDVTISSDTAVVSIGGYGTGFIIGEHLIATAAHCVFERNNDNTHRAFIDFDIKIIDEDGYTVINTIQPKYIHVPKLYFDKPSYDINYDYALIYVEESLSDYGVFGLGLAMDDYILNRRNVTVSGFPAVDGISYNLRVETYGNTYPEYYGVDPQHFHYNAESVGGASGGPVYFNERYTYNNGLGIQRININTAIGINTVGGPGVGGGVKFNEDNLYFYYSNPYVN